MNRQRRFDDDLDLPDAAFDPPVRLSPTAPARPGGRLPIAPERAVELFRQVAESFDRADLKGAIAPLRDLRLFGISVKITLPSRPKEAVAGGIHRQGR